VPHVSPDEDPHSDITELNDEEDNDDDDKSDTEDDHLHLEAYQFLLKHVPTFFHGNVL
jgi:hypothetical protein